MTSHTGLQLQVSCSIDFLIIHPPRKKEEPTTKTLSFQATVVLSAQNVTLAHLRSEALARAYSRVSLSYLSSSFPLQLQHKDTASAQLVSFDVIFVGNVGFRDEGGWRWGPVKCSCTPD